MDLKENISRIKEVMGVQIIKESVFPDLNKFSSMLNKAFEKDFHWFKALDLTSYGLSYPKDPIRTRLNLYGNLFVDGEWLKNFNNKENLKISEILSEDEYKKMKNTITNIYSFMGGENIQWIRTLDLIIEPV